METISKPDIDKSLLRVPTHVKRVLQEGELGTYDVLELMGNTINASADEVNRATDWLSANVDAMNGNNSDFIANVEEIKDTIEEWGKNVDEVKELGDDLRQHVDGYVDRLLSAERDLDSTKEVVLNQSTEISRTSESIKTIAKEVTATKDSVKAYETAIQQNAKDIIAIAASVEALDEGGVKSLATKVSQNADSINSIASKVVSVEESVESNNSKIEQTATAIRSEVTTAIANSKTGIKSEVSSEISQSAQEIKAAVKSELGAMGVNIQDKTIYVGNVSGKDSGALIINTNNFKLDRYGNATIVATGGSSQPLRNEDISKQEIKYKTTSSLSPVPNENEAGWTDAYEPTDEKPYIWKRVAHTYTDGTVVYTVEFVNKYQKGDTGSSGTNGTNGINGYTPIKGIDYFDGTNGNDGANGIGVKYVNIFKRSNATTMIAPTGGTFEEPIPESEGWSDGVPNGSEKCWISTRPFYSDGRSTLWSEPVVMTDTADFDVCYSSKDTKPANPTTRGTQNDATWHNVPQTGDKWMATASCKNGVWSDWQITQILGESGKTQYIHTAWCNDITTWQDFTVENTNGGSYKYQGTCVNFDEQDPGVEYASQYDWVYIKGADGAQGASGYTPIKGVDYFDGEGIKFDGELWSEKLVADKGGVLPKLYAVRMYNKVYIVTNPNGTANPPIWCYTDNNGNKLKFNDGGYALALDSDGNIIENTEEWEAMSQFGADGRDGVDGKDGIGVKYVNVFKRGNVAQMPKPTTGTYDSPIPTDEGWSDGVPSGEAICWISTRPFYSDNRATTWCTPVAMTDTADFDVCFSSNEEQPSEPSAHGTQNDSTWHNSPQDGDSWMATSVKHNGVWSSWQITKIKGEDGTPSYLHTAWCNDITNWTGFRTDNPNGESFAYIGTCCNDEITDPGIERANEYKWAYIKGNDGAQGIGVKYVNVFKRGNVSEMTKPTGGTFDSPIPTGWSDGVPSGTAICWISTRAFYSDGRTTTWSNPVAMTDTADFDCAFSTSETKPTEPSTHGTQNDAVWHNNPRTGDKWMATSVCKNGVWSNWQITQILGEEGKPSYIHTAWCNNISTLEGFTTINPNGSGYKYIGTCVDFDKDDPGIDKAAQYKWVYVKGADGDHGLSGISVFVSTVFVRSSVKPTKPSGGSFSSPIPTGWSDGVPSIGTAPVWCSTCVFRSNNENGTWSDPAQITDTADFDVCYSSDESKPSLSTLPVKGSNTDNAHWHNNGTSDDKWMATSCCKNGVWSEWAITQIKGEDGHSPQIATNGNWILWDDEQGEYVATEYQSKGDDGHQPKIGNDGYWYEWNNGAYQKTSVKAQGDQGYSVTSLGRWQSGMVVPYLGMVRMGSATYLCINVNGTTQPPLGVYTTNSGDYLIYADSITGLKNYVLNGSVNMVDYQLVAQDGATGADGSKGDTGESGESAIYLNSLLNELVGLEPVYHIIKKKKTETAPTSFELSQSVQLLVEGMKGYSPTSVSNVSVVLRYEYLGKKSVTIPCTVSGSVISATLSSVPVGGSFDTTSDEYNKNEVYFTPITSGAVEVSATIEGKTVTVTIPVSVSFSKTLGNYIWGNDKAVAMIDNLDTDLGKIKSTGFVIDGQKYSFKAQADNFKIANSSGVVHTTIDANGNIVNDGSVSVKGKIEATSGTIGGCTISNGALKVPSANITGKLTASQIDATNLNVNAANITGKLTASQIDATNLSINAAKVSGKLTASQIDVDNININALNITGTLSTNQLAANCITSEKLSSDLSSSIIFSKDTSEKLVSETATMKSQIEGHTAEISTSVKKDRLSGNVISNIILTSNRVTIDCDNFKVTRGGNVSIAGKVTASQYRAKILQSEETVRYVNTTAFDLRVPVGSNTTFVLPTTSNTNEYIEITAFSFCGTRSMDIASVRCSGSDKILYRKYKNSSEGWQVSQCNKFTPTGKFGVYKFYGFGGFWVVSFNEQTDEGILNAELIEETITFSEPDDYTITKTASIGELSSDSHILSLSDYITTNGTPYCSDELVGYIADVEESEYDIEIPANTSSETRNYTFRVFVDEDATKFVDLSFSQKGTTNDSIEEEPETIVYTITKIKDFDTISASGGSFNLHEYISTNGGLKGYCDFATVYRRIPSGYSLKVEPNNTSETRTAAIIIKLRQDESKYVEFVITQAGLDSGSTTPTNPDTPSTPTTESQTLEGCSVSGNNVITINGVNEAYTLAYVDSNGNILSNYDKI